MYYTDSMTPGDIQPPSSADRARWAETARRYRVLYGEHAGDVRGLTKQLVGTQRESAWKRVDLSVNLAENTCGQLAAMYLEEPVLFHPDALPEHLVEVRDLFRSARLWPLMDRVQRDTLGMRETAVHLDVSARGEITPRLVHGHRLVAEGGTRPSVPVQLAEARKRTIGEQERWVWDVVQVGQDGSVSSTIRTSLENDAEVYPGAKTDAYHWADRSAFLPYVMYRAAEHGGMWSPYEWAGLFDATLYGCVYRAFVGHTLRTSSWPQRWVANGTIVGTSPQGDGNPEMPEIGSENSSSARRRGLPADPAMVIPIEAAPGSEHPVQVGQWEPAADPEMLLRTVMAADRSALESIGIDPAAVVRTSSDPRSGVALTVSREAQREAQKQWLPLFMASDIELVEKAIAMRNRVLRGSIPERGWQITYRSLPPTETELTSRQARILEQVDRGLMSPVDAYIEFHPGATRDQATKALQEIAAERRRIQAG